MKSLSALALPVAVTLALVATASTAEDRPNTTLVQKSKAAAVSTAKAAKATPSSTPLTGAKAAGAADRLGTKPGAPTSSAPATEGFHDCHGMGADA